MIHQTCRRWVSRIFLKGIHQVGSITHIKVSERLSLGFKGGVSRDFQPLNLKGDCHQTFNHWIWKGVNSKIFISTSGFKRGAVCQETFSLWGLRGGGAGCRKTFDPGYKEGVSRLTTTSRFKVGCHRTFDLWI